MTRARAQALVASLVVAAWLIGLGVALVDGLTVLRATTPLMTGVVGWLFTEKATGG
jgi:hypothetical protein